MVEYKYSHGPLLENRNTYFYSEYTGKEFLKAFYESRIRYKKSSYPCAPKETIYEDFDKLKFIEQLRQGSEIETRILLNAIYHSLEKNHFSDEVQFFTNKILKKFETSKRIYDAYGKNFRTIDSKPYNSLDLYIRACQIFVKAYAFTQKIQYVNVLLKCMDTLCAYYKKLDERQTSVFSDLVHQEFKIIKQLSESKGIE